MQPLIKENREERNLTGLLSPEFEQRIAPTALPYSERRQNIYRFIAILNIIVSGWYLSWRWNSSLNYDAIVFSLALVIAETFSYISLVIFVYNLWTDQDPHPTILSPPALLSEIQTASTIEETQLVNRPITIDIFIATYNEPIEIIEMSILDAKRVTYPNNIKPEIYLLDDGRRSEMHELAKEQEINYITRANNLGFKAGNLCNALHYSSGDFVVICDADARLFPDFLEKTMGYFVDPMVAWVQTPQWFYDIPDGVKPSKFWQSILGKLGFYFGRVIEKLGCKNILHDPFFSDTRLFYDVILRRRNAANASFCCGAGSIHRREALYEVAIYEYITAVQNKSQAAKTKQMLDIFITETFCPIKLHISEDIYTSLIVHSYRKKSWKSIYLPITLSKMLSPQDFESRYNQLYRYAVGTIDITKNNIAKFFSSGLSTGQKIMYFNTLYSYFGAIWNIVFLTAPIIYLLTGVAPIDTTYEEFLKRLTPCLIINEVSLIIGLYGLNSFNSRILSLSLFPLHLKALLQVCCRGDLKFNVTPKTLSSSNRHLRLVIPHITILVLSLIGVYYSLWQLIQGEFYASAGILVINYFWVAFNMFVLGRFILASLWVGNEET